MADEIIYSRTGTTDSNSISDNPESSALISEAQITLLMRSYISLDSGLLYANAQFDTFTTWTPSQQEAESIVPLYHQVMMTK